ncbi:MAG: hypothetical protein IPL31_01300 [Saprospiraceae bacterium]|nr:hypothetical protein [Saprospiraceae bacterium]
MKVNIYYIWNNRYNILNHFKRFYWHYLSLVLTLVIVKLVSSFYPFIIENSGPNEPMKVIWYGLFIILGLPIVYIIKIVNVFIKGFDGVSKLQKVVNFLFSYIVLAVIFSGIYFTIALIGDNIYENKKYAHYRMEYRSEGPIANIQEYNFDIDPRTLTGMNTKLWTGINYPPSSIYSGQLKECEPVSYFSREIRDGYVSIDSDCLFKIAQKFDSKELIKFIPQNIRDYYEECLHFSIHFALSFGFDDLVPRPTFLKLITDLHLILNAALILFGLNFVLSGLEFKIIPNELKE